MDAAKNNAPDLSDQGAQENAHANSEARTARDQSDKAIKTLQARAALRGFTLHIIDNGPAGSAFIVSRWNLSRTLADLPVVEAFLSQAGVRHV